MAEDDSSTRDTGPAAMQTPHARALFQVQHRKPLLGTENLADTIACVVAILLCLVNALVWVFVSGLTIVGILWVVAAAACFKLQSWTRG
jgi:hypothetical protein